MQLRQWFSGLMGAVVLCNGLAAPAQIADRIPKGDITIELETVASGIAGPVWLTHAHDKSGRLFVTSLPGRIELIDDGSVTTYLDFSDDVRTGSERGFLGLAFHPDFADAAADGSGKFYTYSSQRTVAGPNVFPLPDSNRVDHQSVIEEWTVTDPALNVLSEAGGTVSRREVMRIDQPQGNHNGGALVFDLEKNLLIALGDGGLGGDIGGGHTVGVGNGQDKTNILGSLVRIDPLGREIHDAYSVPVDNPFNGADGLREIFAYGLRNPYRVSVDTATGHYYVADVGQNRIEEINRIDPQVDNNGANLGWRIKEGTFDFNVPSGGVPSDLIDPIAEYDHDDGTSVIGGFVYHGSIPALQDKYIFGDLFHPLTAGRLFFLDLNDNAIREFQIDENDRRLGANVFGFGQDQLGEVYVLTGSGDVLRIVPEPTTLTMFCLGSLIALRRRIRG